jgi:hypothetical protein
VVEGLDLLGLRRDHVDMSAGLLDRLARLGELDLLNALIGHQQRDALALQFFRHKSRLLRLRFLLRRIPGH